jgi:signal transduction histidine kinase
VLLLYGMLFAFTSFLLIGFSELLRRSERQLQQANEELKQLSRLRRDFLHIALHNIQAPVGAATMLLNNLRAGFGGSLTPDQDRWVERSLKRLDDVSDFMHDLRVLSSLESGGLGDEAGAVDLRTLLQGLQEEHAELAGARGQRLSLEVPPDLPAVRGIERLLREAVANYVTNAIKYTPEGGRIVIRARRASSLVRIEVQDNGIGIAPEEQEKLFQEFVRIRRSGTPFSDVPGDGLGLSIVRRVVEAHGGKAGVESYPDQGSTFFIQLPALPLTTSLPVVAPDEGEPPSGSS